MKHGLNPIVTRKTNYSFHRTFGGVAPVAFPAEFSVDAGLTMPDQNTDGLYEACTAYTQQDLITDQTGVLHNAYREHYQHTLDLEGQPFGVACDIYDSLKVAVAYYGEGAYYQVESSKLDWFDSIRSVIYTNFKANNIKCAVSTGSPWFKEWDIMSVNSTGIVPTIFTGDPASLSWHNWKISGWKTINGVPYLVAKTWQGRGYGDAGWSYYSRETINAVMKIRGTGAFTLAPRNAQNIQFVKITIWESIIRFLKQLISMPQNDYTTPPQAPVAPPVPPQVPIAQKYLWDTPENARHSVRVICDEEGLTVVQKNLMSQVVHCESGYLTNITHPNLLNGKQVSCDFGICQWNDHYHGKEISPDEAIHNPEKAIRLMCQYVKAGKISQWVCYSSGLYQHYDA